MTADVVSPAAAEAPPRVLIVEDDRYLRKAAEVTLRKRGYEVHTAQDGEEGLRLAGELAPTVILLDLIMPKLQGFQVLERLKANPHTHAIPVIVMSNLGQDADVQRARACGAVDFIVKSNVALADLAGRVQRVVAGEA